MTRSWPRRFAVLCLVPLAAFAVACLLSPLYGDQPTGLGVLPLLLLIEAGVIGFPAVLLALVRLRLLFVIVTVVLTAVYGVWIVATVPIPDDQAGFVFITPSYVGVIAAAVLVPLDVLLGYLAGSRARSTR
ncbi:MAG: hypothetical protein H0V33_06625 [Acidimicrobiia bacterium]|nr:hypothetical protein [Acidimicrobiia bacterium]